MHPCFWLTLLFGNPKDMSVSPPFLFMWWSFRHERDVTAQTEAVYALESFPSSTTRSALTDSIKNEHCFYKVGVTAFIRSVEACVLYAIV